MLLVAIVALVKHCHKEDFPLAAEAEYALSTQSGDRTKTWSAPWQHCCLATIWINHFFNSYPTTQTLHNKPAPPAPLLQWYFNPCMWHGGLDAALLHDRRTPIDWRKKIPWPIFYDSHLPIPRCLHCFIIIQSNTTNEEAFHNFTSQYIG